MPGKPAYIYYHMDFDGLGSIPIAHHLLKNKGFSPVIERPVDFNIKPLWQGKKISVKHPLVIVDFPYRNDAFAYFDHHNSNRPVERSPETELFIFDKNAKSCASLLYNALLGDGVDADELADPVYWCDIIDSKSYLQHNISITDYLYSDQPALMLSKCLEVAAIENKPMFWNSLAERLIKNPSIKDTCKDAEVMERYKTFMENQDEAIRLLKKNSRYDRSTGIVTYDATSKLWSRYGLALIHPDSLLWVVLIKTKKGLDAKISQNPWNPKSQEVLDQTDIGDILKKYGGGGHKFGGSAHFSSHRKAKTSMREIKGHIQRKILG